MSAKLVLDDSIAYVYRLSWIEDGEFGSSLGPERVSAADVEKEKTIIGDELIAPDNNYQDFDL